MTLEDIITRADEELGIRLEFVAGVGIWEAHPALKHQTMIFRIEQSIKPVPGTDGACGCFHVADVLIRFPDGSLKRPDISIFCREPDEQWEAVTLLPEAVIEIISKGHEAKDTEIGAPFYLSQGVKDVILINPVTGEVTHLRRDGEKRCKSPVRIELECGCECMV
jgi:Uma2 family endonuclease